jgi:hypothetical protein
LQTFANEFNRPLKAAAMTPLNVKLLVSRTTTRWEAGQGKGLCSQPKEFSLKNQPIGHLRRRRRRVTASVLTLYQALMKLFDLCK